jgi:hypothetical protein
MERCYVIFFLDGGVAHVTRDSIETYAEKKGFNVTWGRGDAGELTRKDGYTAVRCFVGTDFYEKDSK